MKTISNFAIETLTKVLEKVTLSLEFKKEQASFAFEKESLPFIVAPFEKTIAAIQKFNTLTTAPVNHKTILALEPEEYTSIFGALDEIISDFNKAVNHAQMISPLNTEQFISLFQKINDFQDAKEEFVVMYNEARWPK